MKPGKGYYITSCIRIRQAHVKASFSRLLGVLCTKFDISLSDVHELGEKSDTLPSDPASLFECVLLENRFEF